MSTMKYKPGYEHPEGESDQINVSGRSPRDNLIIEEMAQKQVAESATWLLARKLNSAHGNYTHGDSRQELEALGFQVEDLADELFYQVEPPSGWTKETSGYWTTVRDADGNEIISQFFKGAWYDRDAFLNIK